MDTTDRRPLFVVVVLLVLGASGVLMFMGGRPVPTILSTVGASIGSGPVGAGTGGSTGGGDDHAGGGGSGGKVAATGPLAPPTLLIVRTGTVDLEVTDLAIAIGAADAAVARAGGYVDGSTRTAEHGSAEATVTYRIPSPSWDATLAEVRGTATKIRSEQIETEEVSGQVVDLGARVANLRATEAALQAIMAKATRISDVLDVQSQLTETRGEIERLVADKAHLEERAAYGSLTVVFRLPPKPEVTATPALKPGWDPGKDVERATGRLVRIGQVATSVGIWLTIVGLPLLVAGLVLAFVAWQLRKLAGWVLARRGPVAGPSR
ncbi:MAG TPA: DUF4349 domain-containing protein [Candidatus Limnocylindrales bacterium]|nr:DUF4349 domain-containing protein [Candidatus Limnocylindrales bacterium]